MRRLETKSRAREVHNRIDYLAKPESCEELHSSWESLSKERGARVPRCDDLKQTPEFGAFIIDFLVTAESKQILYSSYESKSEEGSRLVA
jgi:hypothetical protein